MRSSEPSSGLRRYRVHEVLGRGGFGTVYRADLLGEDGFTKEVALKLLTRDGPDRADHLARLRDEARMLGLVRHRALVTVDALVRLDGCPCIVMERIDGASLDDLLGHAGPLPLPAALETIAEVAEALFAAWHTEVDHRPLRLLHRDVKPSNVLLTTAGDVKLLDFGVARADFDSREAETRERLYGSPAYMSPERLELVDSPAGDVFALGITLAEIGSGRRAAAVTARPAQHAERIGRLLEAADPELRPLLARMLAYAPEDRPGADEVAREARALAGQLPGPRLRTWAVERVGPATRGRRSAPGELTGRVLVEESDAFPTNRAETWDEFALPPHDPPAPPSPPPQARRRWWPWLVLLVGGSGASAFGLAVLVGLGVLGAAIAGTLAVWPGLSRITCVNMIEEIDLRLASVSAGPEAGLQSARARRACIDADLGPFGADLLLMQIQKATNDGRFDRGDLESFTRALDREIPAD